MQPVKIAVRIRPPSPSKGQEPAQRGQAEKPTSRSNSKQPKQASSNGRQPFGRMQSGASVGSTVSLSTVSRSSLRSVSGSGGFLTGRRPTSARRGGSNGRKGRELVPVDAEIDDEVPNDIPCVVAQQYDTYATVALTDHMALPPHTRNFNVDFAFNPGVPNSDVFKSMSESFVVSLKRARGREEARRQRIEQRSLQGSSFLSEDDGEDDAVDYVTSFCFMAYGHTNSGKTYTTIGWGDDDGFVTRAAHCLINLSEPRPGGTRRSGRHSGLVDDVLSDSQLDFADYPGSPVEVAAIEIYNDRVFDLLDEGNNKRTRCLRTGDVHVDGLTWAEVNCMDSWQRVLDIAAAFRRTSANQDNSRSSRSHALVMMRGVTGIEVCCVDLAGSERQASSYSKALGKEGISINKSLSALGTVINTLGKGTMPKDPSTSTATAGAGAGAGFINFRDSMLTAILQQYLCGHSQTAFVACLHPHHSYYNEALNTLRYTQRLKKIQTPNVPLGPDVGQDDDVSYMGTAELRTVVTEMKKEFKQLAAVSQQIQSAQRSRIAELEHEVQDKTQLATTLNQTLVEQRQYIEEEVAGGARIEEVAAVQQYFMVAQRLSSFTAASSVSHAVPMFMTNAPELPAMVEGYDVICGVEVRHPKVSSSGSLMIDDTVNGTGMMEWLALEMPGASEQLALKIAMFGVPAITPMHRAPSSFPHIDLIPDVFCFPVLLFRANADKLDVANDADGWCSCCPGYVVGEVAYPTYVAFVKRRELQLDVREAVTSVKVAVAGILEQQISTLATQGRGPSSRHTSFNSGTASRSAYDSRDASLLKENSVLRSKPASEHRANSNTATSTPCKTIDMSDISLSHRTPEKAVDQQNSYLSSGSSSPAVRPDAGQTPLRRPPLSPSRPLRDSATVGTQRLSGTYAVSAPSSLTVSPSRMSSGDVSSDSVDVVACLSESPQTVVNAAGPATEYEQPIGGVVTHNPEELKKIREEEEPPATLFQPSSASPHPAKVPNLHRTPPAPPPSMRPSNGQPSEPAGSRGEFYRVGPDGPSTADEVQNPRLNGHQHNPHQHQHHQHQQQHQHQQHQQPQHHHHHEQHQQRAAPEVANQVCSACCSVQ